MIAASASSISLTTFGETLFAGNNGHPQEVGFAELRHGSLTDGRVIEELDEISVGVAEVDRARPVAMRLRSLDQLDAPGLELSGPRVDLLGPSHQESEVVQPRPRLGRRRDPLGREL